AWGIYPHAAGTRPAGERHCHPPPWLRTSLAAQPRVNTCIAIGPGCGADMIRTVIAPHTVARRYTVRRLQYEPLYKAPRLRAGNLPDAQPERHGERLRRHPCRIDRPERCPEVWLGER